MKNNSLFNIIILSISFLFLFTANNTLGYAQKVIVNTINKEYNVEWDAYISLGIVYLVFSLSNFVVPSILTLISTKYCMFISSLGYFFFILLFYFPVKYSLNIVSGFLGFAAACLWTTHATYISENSTPLTIDRNTGLFWAIYQFCLVFGNLYFYIEFQGVEEVGPKKRFTLLTVLSVTGLIGTVFLLFLRETKSSSTTIAKTSSLTALKRCFNLLKTKKMFFLAVASFYTGIEQSFFGGIYPTSVAFTKDFGIDSVKLIGLYGMFCGFGAIIGSLVFGLFCRLFDFFQKNRFLIYFIGFSGQVIASVLIFLNHPNRSPIEETEGYGIIKPQVWISLFCGFLLCLGDALFNISLISLIGSIYSEANEASSAFAIYKFTHCIGASSTFFYASFNLTMDIHLLILIIFANLGVCSFYLAEKIFKKDKIDKNFPLDFIPNCESNAQD